MATTVAQIKGRKHVAHHRQDEELGADAEAKKSDHSEQQRDAELEDAELVGPQLEVRADEVALKPAALLLRRYPRRRARRFEPPAELLADVGQRSVGDPHRLLRTGRLLRT